MIDWLRSLFTDASLFTVCSPFLPSYPVIAKAETDLTAEMIQDGSWRTKTFKPYNFKALGIMPPSGYLHPLLKVRTEFRQIFLEMGFTEMPTNNFIESSFWNFDALFQVRAGEMIWRWHDLTCTVSARHYNSTLSFPVCPHFFLSPSFSLTPSSFSL